MKTIQSRWPVGLALAAVLPLSSLVISGTASAVTPSQILLPRHDIMVASRIAQSLKQGTPLPASAPFSFGVILPSRDPSGLQAFAQSVSNPQSPNYRHFLTRQEAAQRFGPDPTVVEALTAEFAGAGFRTVVAGQLMTVSGTVGQVNALLHTQMMRYQWKGSTLVAPATGVATLPSWLQAAVGLTGLVVAPPDPGIVRTPHAAIQYAPKASMAPTPSGSTVVAENNGFQVVVTRETGGAREPGEAVRYQITAYLDGQPDPGQISVSSVTGPFLGATPLFNQYFGDNPNQILMDFTLSQQQSVSLSATVTDGTNSVTVQLPQAGFLGPNAKTVNATSLDPNGLYGITGPMIAPWNPASNSPNTAMNASQLVALEQRHIYDYFPSYYNGGAPSIGVYTAGGLSSNNEVSGISFSVPEQDAIDFANQFNLPQESFTTGYVGPNSEPDSTYGGIEGEMSLDLQEMETSAPGANIVVYSAGSLRSALAEVGYQDQVQVYSISYGAGDQVIQALEPGAEASWDQLAEYANAEGITISVSAGDNAGYSGAQYLSYVPSSVADAPQPSYPASSSYVTALGGTEDSVATNGTVTQSALWGGELGSELSVTNLLDYLSYGNMMGSGGISAVEPAPSYQTNLNPNLTGRMTPDVTLPASVVTPGYYDYFDGTPGLSGGTSAAAPLFAGYMADLATVYSNGEFGLGNINPALYAMSQWPSLRLPEGPVVSPVAFGNNGAYGETVRDNAVTGLGQLNVDGFASAFLGTSLANFNGGGSTPPIGFIGAGTIAASPGPRP